MLIQNKILNALRAKAEAAGLDAVESITPSGRVDIFFQRKNSWNTVLRVSLTFTDDGVTGTLYNGYGTEVRRSTMLYTQGYMIESALSVVDSYLPKPGAVEEVATEATPAEV